MITTLDFRDAPPSVEKQPVWWWFMMFMGHHVLMISPFESPLSSGSATLLWWNHDLSPWMRETPSATIQWWSFTAVCDTAQLYKGGFSDMIAKSHAYHCGFFPKRLPITSGWAAHPLDGSKISRGKWYSHLLGPGSSPLFSSNLTRFGHTIFICLKQTISS